jgi:hypothetical protein
MSVSYLPTRGLLLVAAIGGLATAAACSGAGGDGGEGATSKSSGNNGAQNGAGVTGSGGDPILTASMGSGGTTGTGQSCAESNETATLVPVNMFITVDKSGSMDDDNKWVNAEAAFNAFFQDPAASSLRVALRFWPDDGCDENTCNTDICSQPLVDIGPLSEPAHVQSLVSAFASRDPGGLTPTSAALAGATKWAKDYTTTVEGTEKVVVILVTDGEPTACQENINDIASYAADAYATAGVPTFAVGMAGSNEGQMDIIAQAGNTGMGIFIGNGNAQADLLAALQAIQASQVSCVFAMPEGVPGKPVDPAKVNVNYTAGGTTEPQLIGQVPDEGACAANGGWFYDDPVDPAIITLCPTTCSAVQGDEAARIEIVVGCSTVPA